MIRFPIEEFNKKYPYNPNNIINIPEKKNNKQERNNKKIYNDSDNNTTDEKVLILICPSCFLKNICMTCRKPSSDMSGLSFKFFAHSDCWKENTCFNCRQTILKDMVNISIMRICQKCKNKYIIRDTECFICHKYFRK